MMLIIKLYLCFISFSMLSQNVQFSGALDLRNAIAGSEPTNNKPAFNALIGFQMIDHNGIEVGIEYESFSQIGYWDYSMSVGYQMPITERFKIVPNVSLTLISRDLAKADSEFYGTAGFLTFNANLGFRYELNDYFDIEFCSNLSPRPDMNYMYGGNHYVISNYGKLIYKIKL